MSTGRIWIAPRVMRYVSCLSEVNPMTLQRYCSKMWPETLWLSRNSNDSQCQLLNNKSSVQVKFTYALWKNSDCMHIDWIKENGKKAGFNFWVYAFSSCKSALSDHNLHNKFATAGTSSLKAHRSAECGLVRFSKIPTAPESFTNANLQKNLLSFSFLILFSWS